MPSLRYTTVSQNTQHRGADCKLSSGTKVYHDIFSNKENVSNLILWKYLEIRHLNKDFNRLSHICWVTNSIYLPKIKWKIRRV